MTDTPVVVVFTARPLEEILQHGGSRDWRLDPERARRAEYLVCTHNRHNPAFRAPTAPHRAATLVGHIAEVVPSPEAPDRWLIRINEYIALTPAIPNIWGKSGHLRYPVWYTTLEELGIELSALPPFRPMPPPGGAGGMRERPAAPIIAPPDWMQTSRNVVKPADDRHVRPQHAGGQDAWRRMDAILDQIDRVPDLPTPSDPLDWDDHGLPR
jgi:hypothetical protein